MRFPGVEGAEPLASIPQGWTTPLYTHWGMLALPAARAEMALLHLSAKIRDETCPPCAGYAQRMSIEASIEKAIRESLADLLANAGGDELRETLLQCARLQQVRAKKLLSPADVAALYGIPPATLATWRCRGVGPDFIKAESSVYYLPEQMDAWLRRCAVVMPR